MTSDEKRQLAVSLMKGREGRNTYTNGSRRQYFFGYPGDGDDGYSDCSSAVRACIERAAGIDIGSNTDKQIRNLLAGKGRLIDAASGARYLPDESKLLPGDCLYFKGNTSHVKNVGHVEMYTGTNECWGHGSGAGPTKKNMQEYCRRRRSADRRYFCAVRWIPDAEAVGQEEAAGQAQTLLVTARGTWRIRENPGTLCRTLAFVQQGDEMEYCAHCKNDDGSKWVQVRRGNVTGWISYKAVKKAI